MYYKIEMLNNKKKIHLAHFRGKEKDARNLASSVLKKLVLGEVIINRRMSFFDEWKWWLSLKREENYIRPKEVTRS